MTDNITYNHGAVADFASDVGARAAALMNCTTISSSAPTRSPTFRGQAANCSHEAQADAARLQGLIQTVSQHGRTISSSVNEGAHATDLSMANLLIGHPVSRRGAQRGARPLREKNADNNSTRCGCCRSRPASRCSRPNWAAPASAQRRIGADGTGAPVAGELRAIGVIDDAGAVDQTVVGNGSRCCPPDVALLVDANTPAAVGAPGTYSAGSIRPVVGDPRAYVQARCGSVAPGLQASEQSAVWLISAHPAAAAARCHRRQWKPVTLDVDRLIRAVRGQRRFACLPGRAPPRQ